MAQTKILFITLSLTLRFQQKSILRFLNTQPTQTGTASEASASTH
ncbi:MAG: hypothetical protein ACJ0BJ_02730 [Pirellulales bacterium]